MQTDAGPTSLHRANPNVETCTKLTQSAWVRLHCQHVPSWGFTCWWSAFPGRSWVYYPTCQLVLLLPGCRLGRPAPNKAVTPNENLSVSTLPLSIQHLADMQPS